MSVDAFVAASSQGLDPPTLGERARLRQAPDDRLHVRRVRGCSSGGRGHRGRVLEPSAVSELLVVVSWTRPLHVVVVVDDARREERIVTVYEPDPDLWSADYRRRR